MGSFYWKYIHRTDESATWRWGFGLCIALALMPALGSVITGVLSAMCLFGLTYIYHGHRTLSITRSELLIGLILAAYVLISLIYSVMHDRPYEGLALAANNSGFIAILFLMPVVRKFSGDGKFWFEAGVIGAGVILLVMTPWEFFTYPGNRVELLSSNPLVLSWMAGSIAIFSFCILFTTAGWLQRLSGVAFVGALIAVILAGGRAPIIFLGLVLTGLVIFYVSRLRWRQALMVIISGVLLLAIGIQLAKSNRSIQVLQERFVTGFEQLKGNNPDGRFSYSVRFRLAYLKHGVPTFLEAPFSGHGRQNVMRETLKNVDDERIANDHLTHLHNAYLTEAVASGILGILSLFAVTMTPIIAAWRKPRRYLEMAVAFSLFTNFCFLTNIGFYHDVMVFFFCLVVVFLNRQNDVMRETAT